VTKHFSALSLFKEGLNNQEGWVQAWGDPAPKPRYDLVIIGGGGHGLATAYYLAKTHGIANVAVIEKGWLGGGNTGRNTTVVRSNYFFPESVRLYDMALRMYEGLSRELNYNIMLSQRGMISLAHTPTEMEMSARVVNAMQINGTDAELFGTEDVRRVLPIYNFTDKARYPALGGVWQGRSGTARHDAVAWGYARAAAGLGVDIIQQCEVLDFVIEGDRCRGVVTAAARSEPKSWAWPSPGIRRSLRPRRGSVCRLPPMRCRPACRNRSSPCWTRSSCRPGPAPMPASPTRVRWS
jgi:sarcosine oxidase subunit beta